MCCHEKEKKRSGLLGSMVAVPKTLFLHAPSFCSHFDYRPVYKGKTNLFEYYALHMSRKGVKL